MTIIKTITVSLVALMIGTSAGLILGFTLWAQEATQISTLSHELDKTRVWLLDEISWSDERCDQVSAALTKAQAELTQTRRELLRARGPNQALGNVRVDGVPTSDSDAASIGSIR